ncbi:MAG: hypothetical protein AB8G15_02605 [Saprospiraceae bacterium]
MNDIDLIRKYLANQLAPAEQAAFQQRLSTDAELTQKVSEYQTIFAGFRSLRTEAFEQEVKQWEKQSQTATPRPVPTTAKRFPLKWIAIAASIILLIGLSVSYWQNDPLQDFLQNNASYAQADLIRGEETKTADLLFFKNYQAANDYLKAEKFSLAAESFEKIIQLNNYPASHPQDVIHWKKIISLLKQYERQPTAKGKTALTQDLDRFLSLANDKDIYKAKAERLKEILEA